MIALRSSMIDRHLVAVFATIPPRPQDLAEGAHIATPQSECLFVWRGDAEPEKCAAGNGNGENGSHWSATGCRRWGQTGYQHRPISIAKNSQQKTGMFA